MIKKVAIREMGISINGLIAINQFLKKKKITNTTSVNEITMVSFTSDKARRTFFVLSIGTENSISDLFCALTSSSLL